MEVIRALIMIFLGLVFLGFIFRVLWPIIAVFAIFLFGSALMTSLRRKPPTEDREPSRRQEYDQRSSRTTSAPSQNPNVIDAEFTEEELD